MKEAYHADLLSEIKKRSGKATQHTFQDNYLGNDHPRYPISNPVLRKIASEWMREHLDLSATQLTAVVTELMQGKSGTEKLLGAILLDYAKKPQYDFDPRMFDKWLSELVGWAEVDMLCSSKYTHTQIISQWEKWEPLLLKLSKSRNINKRRASLVLLVAPVRKDPDERLAMMGLQIIGTLKAEKEVMITKAISWLLRSMIAHHKEEVSRYISTYEDTLPRIAVRETLAKIRDGVKTKRKSK